MIAGIVLAAGAGRRFGTPKATVEYGGERLVDRATRLLTDGGCAPVYVVTGAIAVEATGAVTVHNPDWPRGMGSTLRKGLAEAAGAQAAVVVPVDMPWLGPASVERLIAAYNAGATVAVATYDGKRGHPVLFAASTWADVSAAATGDQGARAYLAAHPEQVTLVPCDGTGDPRDVDTPGDLRRGPPTDA